MAKYISLLRFTEQGAKDIKKSIKRAHEFGKLASQGNVRTETMQAFTDKGFDEIAGR